MDFNVNMNLKVVDYDPSQGQAFQGDVMIAALNVAKYGAVLNRSNEIPARQGRVILAEGEVTGHHHSIAVSNTTAAVEALKALATEAAKNVPVAGQARLYKDDALSQKLVQDGFITRTDLVRGYLEVTGAPMVLEHQEHDGFRLPEGLYLISGQIESAGAEQRQVAD